jgi:hypothetical protein
MQFQMNIIIDGAQSIGPYPSPVALRYDAS